MAITTPLFSSQRVVEDIKRKGDDIDRVIDLSADLQDVLDVRPLIDDSISPWANNLSDLCSSF